jgi:hypothetical protein
MFVCVLLCGPTLGRSNVAYSKSTIFWDIPPCNLLKVNLSMSNLRIEQHYVGTEVPTAVVMKGTIFWTFNGLHGVITQELILSHIGVRVTNNCGF